MDFIHFLVLSFTLLCVKAIPAEDTLHDNLFSEYHSEILPRERLDESVAVGVSFSLINFDDINEQHEKLSAFFYVSMQWTDYRLAWKPEYYGRVNKTNVDPKKIWKPDLCSYQADSKVLHPDNYAVLNSGGEIFWIPFKKYTVYCVNKTTDEMKCRLKVGSWVHATDEMTVMFNNKEVDTSTFASRGEWDLKDISQEKNTVYYACCPKAYETISIFMTLKKRST